MDIKINCDEGKFKFRVCGILKYNNKYLAIKMNGNNFYCLPGGHVELGEDTDTAIKREMQEELGYNVDIEKTLCVIQNFFKDNNGKQFHELGYYYIVVPTNPKDVNQNDYFREEIDKGELKKHKFSWFTLEELKAIDFRPKKVLDCIDLNEFSNIISKE